MAIYQTTAPSDNTTVANFKAWAMAVSSGFSALGWLQTSDTGQVNWASVVSVPANNAYVYEVWKANDALAAVMPIVIKIEYGTVSGGPQMRVTIGTSSNGTGTITGSMITGIPWQLFWTAGGTNQGSTFLPCYFSGHAGEFRMYLFQSTTINSCLFFGIERSKDATGADTGEYWTALHGCPSTVALNIHQQTVLTGGQIGNLETNLIAIGFSAGSNTGSALGTVAALPIFPVTGKVRNPMLGFLSVAAADVVDGQTVAVQSMYGTTHTYIAMKNATGGNGITGAFGLRSANAATMAGLMRYE